MDPSPPAPGLGPCHPSLRLLAGLKAHVLDLQVVVTVSNVEG